MVVGRNLAIVLASLSFTLDSTHPFILNHTTNPLFMPVVPSNINDSTSTPLPFLQPLRESETHGLGMLRLPKASIRQESRGRLAALLCNKHGRSFHSDVFFQISLEFPFVIYIGRAPFGQSEL